MNGWGWVLIGYMVVNTLASIAMIGRRKKSQTYQASDAIIMVGITAVAWMAVAS